MRPARVLVAGALLAAAVAVHGQTPPPVPSPQVPPVFRGSVELTQFDVSVLDAVTRRPVHGLTVADFELLIDGQVQPIEAVAEVNIPDPEEGPAWMRGVASDVRSNSAEDGRVIVFLLDEVQTPSTFDTPVVIEAVKRIARQVIDRMGPNDIAAVLFTWDNRRYSQDFTTNRDLLRQAVDRFSPKQFQLSFAYDWQRVSAGVAGSLMKYLADAPGRRKAIIYFTPRMLIRPPWPWPPGGPSVGDLYVLTAFEQALRAGVTVYGISPTGLKALGNDDDPLSLTGPAAAGRGSSPGERAGAGRPSSGPRRSLAEETGGFVINTPAQLAQGVEQIFRETGSYYLIGYKAPPDFSTRGDSPTPGYKPVEVRVKREGLLVRGRTGYVPARPPKPPKEPVPPVALALSGVLPKSDLPLRAAAAPFATAGQPGGAVIMVLGVEEPASAERVGERITMQARAFTVHGEARGITQRSLDATLGAGRTEPVQFDILSELPLKPGRYELRLSARSDRLDTEGSVYVDVTVPDFAKDPLSLSGLVLVANPATAGAPAIPLASRLPFTPTTRRTFERVDRVGAFLRVYQGGKKAPAPVDMTVRVVDNQDRVVLERRDTLEASRFGTARAADYRLDLPLATLSAGPHLLRIDAAIGPVTTRREIRFSVK